MKLEERKNILYRKLISNQKLDTKTLISNGFTQYDIKVFLDNNILRRVGRGEYEFLDLGGLFDYSIDQISYGKNGFGYNGIEACYLLDNTYFRACYELLLNSLEKKDYENVCEYFKNAYINVDKDKINDLNFILLLFSKLELCTDELKEKVNDFSIDDITCNDEKSNSIRINAYNEKYGPAIADIYELKLQKNLDRFDNIIKIILNKLKSIDDYYNNYVYNCINNENYEELIIYLSELLEKDKLRKSGKYLLKLSKIIIEIKNTNTIPKIHSDQSYNLSQAIDNNDFCRAIEFVEEKMNYKNYNKEKNHLWKILTKINSLVDEINSIETEKIIEEVEEEVKEVENVSNNEKSYSYYQQQTISYYLVTNALFDNDIESAIENVDTYLNILNKREYTFLVLNLIKISVLENDSNFSKVLIILTKLVDDRYAFNPNIYIKEFYNSLYMENFEVAYIYLDILKKSNKLGFCIDCNLLESVLNYTVNLFNVTNNVPTVEKFNEETTPVIEEENVKVQEYKRELKKVELNNNEMSSIDDKCKKLEESKSILLLKRMSDSKREKIIKYISKYPNIVCRVIGLGNEKQILLRYKKNEKRINLKQTLATANDYFKNYKFKDALNEYLKLLSIGEPPILIYAKIGLCYFYLRKKKNAIPFFQVATLLSEESGEDYNFRPLLEKLDGKILTNPDDLKFNVHFDIKELNSSENNNYGIDSINDIALLLKEGFSLEEACNKYELTEEQIMVVYLIYARECYIYGDYEYGDEYLKKVERMKNKTEFVKNLFNEIVTNKKFYEHRTSENHSKIFY